MALGAPNGSLSPTAMVLVARAEADLDATAAVYPDATAEFEPDMTDAVDPDATAAGTVEGRA